MNGGQQEPETRAEEQKAEEELAEAGVREKAKERGGPEKPREKPLEKMTKAELMEKIQEVQEEARKYYDLYLRSQADLDNLKKRTSKEKAELAKFANESLVKELLPVMDNLEMAISHAHSNNSLQALKEGVELTLKGLKDTLIKSGLEEVEARNKPFDPNFHHAVSEREDDSVEPGTVLEEMQKGYIFNQRLIRPAMVVVSKPKKADGGDENRRVATESD